jgi:hypothetical protein
VFRCGYDAVTGWDGLRAVVTEVPGGWGSSTSSTAGTSGTTGGAGGTNGQQQQGLGRRFWVDMPFPGVEAPLEGQVRCVGAADAAFSLMHCVKSHLGQMKHTAC